MSTNLYISNLPKTLTEVVGTLLALMLNAF